MEPTSQGRSVHDSQVHSASAQAPVHTLSGSLCPASIRTSPDQRLLRYSVGRSITAPVGAVKRHCLTAASEMPLALQSAHMHSLQGVPNTCDGAVKPVLGHPLELESLPLSRENTLGIR